MWTDEGVASLTGAVEFVVTGDQLPPSKKDRLASIEGTRFLEDSAFRRQLDGGKCTITYVPREPATELIPEALTTGVLLFRMEMKGRAPRHINLRAGTYFYFLHYLRGRWTGFAVNSGGSVMCASVGLRVKQAVRIHPGKDHLEKPNIFSHPVMSNAELRSFGPDLPLAASDDWVEYQHDWRPFGAGCWADIICIPAV